jgi:hypothetical protein
VDTGANVTVARPDIAAGWPERQPDQRFRLQRASGETLTILNVVFVTLTLGRRPLKILVFVAHITNEFIIGLGILHAYSTSVDLWRQTLRLAEVVVSLLSPGGGGPRPSSLVVARDQVIPAQWKGTVMARLQSHLGVENGLVSPSPQAPPPEGFYIDRTLAQDRQEVPARVLNATHRDQKLTRGSPLAQCEPVTLVTPPELERQLD